MKSRGYWLGIARMTAVAIRWLHLEKRSQRHAPQRLVGDRAPVIGQHDVAVGDADVLDKLFAMLDIGPGGDAEWKWERIVGCPLNFDDCLAWNWEFIGNQRARCAIEFLILLIKNACR